MNQENTDTLSLIICKPLLLHPGDESISSPSPVLSGVSPNILASSDAPGDGKHLTATPMSSHIH